MGFPFGARPPTSHRSAWDGGGSEVIAVAAGLGPLTTELNQSCHGQPLSFVMDHRFIVGQSVELDSENQYFFGGAITTHTAEGWGFPYYQLTEAGPLAGTRMAIPPGAPKVARFVQVRGEFGLIRYNSKIPVVYVPKGFEVKYRVWAGRNPAKSAATE